ncbi:hypothetical protein CSC94_06995 [Zhengella mangrovi]|uniref:Colanic acid biosynthesis glycosyltransferase WcaL n=1 Tax=Zhengella mangrovi TaxID=1982044 RepID=A0A2G1QPP4_9HYPH|nr:glycosyltransferase family 4 protein [Zhengella mangrovi]PHP67449.1 hypothetical protein CSC94_06995 [Zhengella mangrovi]
MKTIAYVLTDFPVLSETFVGNEIRAMQAHGHRVVPFVFHLRDGPAQPADREIAARAHTIGRIAVSAAFRVAPLAWRSLSLVCRQKRLPRRSLLWTGMKLAGAIRDAKCDHIHAHFAGGAAAHALVAGRITDLPVSFTCHGHDIYAEPEDLEIKLAEADRVVAVCRDMEDDLKQIAPNAAISGIPCGTDTTRFEPRPETEHDNGRFLFIGRLVGQKGIDDLLRALRLLERTVPIRLDIVGEGPLHETVSRETEFINQRGFHEIRLLGQRNADWLQAEGPRYRGVVLPFKTAADGSRDTGPLVVKEAMALGLPVVSTAFMGVKETVTEETGFLVPPASPDALACAMAQLATMPDEHRRQMGQAGRKRVCEHFTLAAQARALSGMVEAA